MLVSDENKALEVIRALSDEYSRKIILSIISESLPIDEISKEQNIPISTCYRRIHEMLEFGVIKPDRTIIREDGKKYVCYKSAIKNATISMDAGMLKVDVVVNKDPSERLDSIWSSVRGSASSTTATDVSFQKLQSSIQRISPVVTT